MWIVTEEDTSVHSQLNTTRFNLLKAEKRGLEKELKTTCQSG